MSNEQTLCADYLLALLSPEKETFVVDSTHWKAGLAGAAVVEAVLAGALRLTEQGEPGTRPGRLVRTGVAAPAVGSVWDEVIERADGQKPKNAVGRIGGASTWRDRAGELRDAVLADLVREEVIAPREHRTLGLFPTPRWALIRPDARDAVLRRVTETLAAAGTGPLVERDASLAAILHASGALPKLFPKTDRRRLKEQGKALTEVSWGSQAVGKAIQDVNTAVAAGVVAAVAGGTAASS